MAKTLYYWVIPDQGRRLIRRTHEALGGRLTIRAIYQQQSILTERLRAAGITAVMNNGNCSSAERSPDNRRELVFHELSGVLAIPAEEPTIFYGCLCLA